MEEPTLESRQNIRIPSLNSTHRNRWASGDSLWSECKTNKLLEGRGSCIEAET